MEFSVGTGLTLVKGALEHLQRHCLEPGLSLQAVAGALRCNPKYLAHRFKVIVGERMHTYLVMLRLDRACRMLAGSELLVKEVAHASGFPGPERLTRTFKRYVGVSPREYRRIFATH